eukprot:7613-Heterococcus_DN1.PRE.2
MLFLLLALVSCYISLGSVVRARALAYKLTKKSHMSKKRSQDMCVDNTSHKQSNAAQCSSNAKQG